MTDETMPAEELVALAKSVALHYALDPALVCAVCEQESNWEPWAIRFEPDFEERYVAKLHLGPTESIARSISWGLMQVMGETAREHGYLGKLAQLCDPETGLNVGATVLSYKLALARREVARALELYNGGGNPAYADQVLRRMAKYQ